MSLKTILVQSLMLISIAGCATGKAINDPKDIRDDGKRNVVLLTHDLKIYVTEKHSSVNQASLVFRCPSASDKLKPSCFTVDLPYLGTKEIDGFGLHAFEKSSASAVKMKYDNYSLQSATHNIVIDRIPETDCYVAKKTKKTICNTVLKDVYAKYISRFPNPVPVRVAPGAGCYMGHLAMTVVDNRIVEFNLDTDAPLTADKLTDLSSDVASTLLQVVNRPC